MTPIIAVHTSVAASSSPIRTNLAAAAPESSPPTIQGDFPGLHKPELDNLHHRREGQRVGEDRRDIEELKGGVEFEAYPVRATNQFDHKHDLPDQRQTRARGGQEVRGKLREHKVTQNPTPSQAINLCHFQQVAVERPGALAERDG